MKLLNTQRIFGLDLIRVVAIVLVVMVHSFANTGFNAANLNGMSMFILLNVRNLAFIGVLLFIMLTGYCKSEKKIDKNHYKSIKHILVTYLIISAITIIFRKYFVKENIDWYNAIVGVLNFTLIPYAWYFEMYIGLFFLIPFLNILYNGLQTKKNKQILILTLFLIVSLPATLSTLSVATRSLNILPDWWGRLYPILLYYLGVYIKEYKPNINKCVNIIFIFSLLFLESFIMYFYCMGDSINNKIIIDYNYLPAIIVSVLVFILLYNVKIKGNIIKSIFKVVSNVTFGLYLFSYIFDKVIYNNYALNIHGSKNYLLGLILYTPIILFLSFICAYILDIIIKWSYKIIDNLKKEHEKRYANL